MKLAKLSAWVNDQEKCVFGHNFLITLSIIELVGGKYMFFKDAELIATPIECVKCREIGVFIKRYMVAKASKPLLWI